MKCKSAWYNGATFQYVMRMVMKQWYNTSPGICTLLKCVHIFGDLLYYCFITMTWYGVWLLGTNEFYTFMSETFHWYLCNFTTATESVEPP